MRVRPIVLAMLAALGAAGSVRPLHGDVEETERRLKALGIEAPLRERIHAAIDRSVAYLRTRQAPDGRFAHPGTARSLEVGTTALCAFALRHAGTPPAREAAATARAWLFRDDDSTRPGLVGSTYEAGIALLFLHADQSGEGHAQRLARALEQGQDRRTGWWSYVTGVGAGQGGSGGWAGIPRYVNLSTTQFAVLGLRAARRHDPAPRTRVLRNHLVSLLEYQSPDGSWPYDPQTWQAAGPSPMGSAAFSYATGTYMGLANLVLAEALLGPDDTLVKTRAEELRLARRRGEEALYRHARWTLLGLPTSRHQLSGHALYSLYALEKACVFLGLERIGDLAWYRAGAERLVALQGQDGAWSSARWNGAGGADADPLVDTAFGLLFLLRTSETLRPVTPASVDTPRPAAVTPADGTPPPADVPRQPVRPVPATIPMSQAWIRLAQFRALVSDVRTENARLLAAMDGLAAIDGALVPDPGAAPLFDERRARWRTERTSALLDAFALVRAGPGRELNLRGAVNQRAAELLVTAGPEASPRLCALLERVHLAAEPQAAPAALGAAFDALAAQGDPASATWLVERVLDTDQRFERVARTERVLRALSRFAALPGAVRRACFERILRSFEAHEQAHDHFARGTAPPASQASEAARVLVQRQTFYAWEWLRYDAILALLTLAGDTPATPTLRTPNGERILTVQEARTWWRAHDAPTAPPWR